LRLLKDLYYEAFPFNIHRNFFDVEYQISSLISEKKVWISFVILKSYGRNLRVTTTVAIVMNTEQ